MNIQQNILNNTCVLLPISGGFGQWKNQADKKIYFVEYANQADLKIYFVKYENQAGWNNKSKIQLMY